jgi:hypothetical protein
LGSLWTELKDSIVWIEKIKSLLDDDPLLDILMDMSFESVTWALKKHIMEKICHVKRKDNLALGLGRGSDPWEHRKACS